MAFSSGTFSRLHDWTTDRDAGIKISASRTDAEFDGIATGLTTCILKDGTQTLTAMIPFTLGLSLPTDKKIQLRDSAIFINSSGDGQLNMAADTSVTITTPSLIITDNTTDEPIVQIKNTHNGTTAGELRFVMDKGAAGADGDDLGTISFYGDDAGQNQTAFAKIVGEVSEADETDEAGKLSLFVAESDGTNTALTAGLVLEGEHATDGEVDVTIGAGAASTTTVAGVLNVTGAVLQVGNNASIDSQILFDAQAGNWSIGVDQSDSGFFKVSESVDIGTEDRLCFEASGNVNVKTGNLVIGTSGKGIDFSATSDGTTSTSEILDDYEEGNWNATLSPQTSGSVSISNDGCQYVKIGQIVHVSGIVQVNSVSSPDGVLRMGGFPFANANLDDLSGGVLATIQIQAATIPPYRYGMWMQEGDSTADIFNFETGSDQPVGDAADQFGGNESIYFQLTYRTT
jgi:hypothetical protein